MSKLDEDGEIHSVSLYLTTLPTTIAVAILSPVAVVGNTLVLAAIWRNRSLRTPSYILLDGLAFTDFCTGLISQPFYAATKLIYLVDPQPKPVLVRPTFLIIESIADGSVTYLTPLTMSIITVMSMERWLHMARRSLITVRRVSYTVAGLLLLHTPYIVYHVLHVFNNTIYIPEINIASLLFSLFCLIVTSAAYFKVFQIVRSHQQQIQANVSSQVSAQPGINIVKYKKSVFTVLYILAIFYVSFFPLAIAFGLTYAWESEDKDVIGPYLDVVMLFVFLSSSLNPFLYLWRMNDIRNEVTSLVRVKLCKVN